MLGIGLIIYTVVLCTNAIAILSEDRFLAQSQSRAITSTCRQAKGFWILTAVGWSASQAQINYDPNGYGEPAGAGIKARLITLVAAVRTLMRGTVQHFSTTLGTAVG